MDIEKLIKDEFGDDFYLVREDVKILLNQALSQQRDSIVEKMENLINEMLYVTDDTISEEEIVAKIKNFAKEMWEKHKEKRKDRQKRYYEENREKIR